MQKITPCLWFNGNAEEAVNYYLSVFKDAKKNAVSRYGEGAPVPAGTALTIDFELNGTPFQALNAGPEFTFSEAISFVVYCKDQAEVDYYWNRLGDGGEFQPCGWLKDRFGVSWQIVPVQLGEMMQDPDPARANRVMQALLGMGKLDIAGLQAAYRGTS
jgi:predicted 3-demethylubiquinone-9 3-methyltransferase (glyoxalase superfamily)